jgi:hypothetical protein
MLFFAILAGHEWHVQFDQREIIGGFRPVPEKATRKQAALLESMWATDPLARPTFREVLERLQEADVWGAGINEQKFAQYRGTIDRAEAGSLVVTRPSWQGYLRMSSSPIDLTPSLTFGDQVALALAILTGSPGCPNARVFEAALSWNLSATASFSLFGLNFETQSP